MGWDIQPKYSPVGAGVEGSQKRGQLLKGNPQLAGGGKILQQNQLCPGSASKKLQRPWGHKELENTLYDPKGVTEGRSPA